jgi:hypothetical protein
MRSTWLLIFAACGAPVAGEYDVQAEIVSDTCSNQVGAKLSERVYVDTPVVALSLPLGIVPESVDSSFDPLVYQWLDAPQAYNLGEGLRYVGDSKHMECGPSVRQIEAKATASSPTSFDLEVTQTLPATEPKSCLAVESTGIGRRFSTLATPACTVVSRHRYRRT